MTQIDSLRDVWNLLEQCGQEMSEQFCAEGIDQIHWSLFYQREIVEMPELVSDSKRIPSIAVVVEVYSEVRNRLHANSRSFHAVAIGNVKRRQTGRQIIKPEHW